MAAVRGEDGTRKYDDVAVFLEAHYPNLNDAVLVIHTKQNGEISEVASGKSKEEPEVLRSEANESDKVESHWKEVVSVMMLNKGWDVRNVTTIIGLRADWLDWLANSKPPESNCKSLRRSTPCAT